MSSPYFDRQMVGMNNAFRFEIALNSRILNHGIVEFNYS